MELTTADTTFNRCPVEVFYSGAYTLKARPPFRGGLRRSETLNIELKLFRSEKKLFADVPG